MSKHVVIIGNGAAGSQTAAALKVSFAKNKKAHKITVLSAADYCEVSVLMTQVVATGTENHKKALFPPIREDGINYVVDSCKSVASDHLITAKGDKIVFDVCIVATGHSIPIFLPGSSDANMEERVSFISDMHQKIVDAKNIVISGGGAIGCEVAADIILRYKDKKVTVVHSHSSVLHTLSEPFHPITTRLMEEMGIDLITSNRVESFDESKKMITLKSGDTLPCDLFLPAHATGGNSSFMPEGTTNSRKYIKVNDYLQVDNPNYSNIFAVGDVSAFDENKSFLRIADQVPSLVANINALLDSKPLTPHNRGASFESKISGPLMVALGHDVDGAKGLGPDLPGCMGWCCFMCCCCQPPHGKMISKLKFDFNATVKPIPGKGITSG